MTTIAEIEAAVLHAVDAALHPAGSVGGAAPSEPVKTVEPEAAVAIDAQRLALDALVAATADTAAPEIQLGPTYVGE